MNAEAIREEYKGQNEMATWETVLRVPGTMNNPDVQERNRIIGEALMANLAEGAEAAGIVPLREPRWMAAKQIELPFSIVPEDFEVWCIVADMPIERYDA